MSEAGTRKAAGKRGRGPAKAPAADARGGEPPLLVVRRDRIAILTLNRPAQRNSLSVGLLADFSAAIAEVGADAEVHAVVLAAAGSTFCAGHDLRELAARRSDGDGGREFYRQAMQACSGLMQAIVRCPKPVIAAVEGTATAAGCQLVATCDLAVAGVAARFCTPGVDIGLFCSTPTVALTRNVPRKRAMEMLLLGDMVSAPAAADLGLINQVVPAGQALAAAAEMAGRIAAKSPLTVAVGKQAFYRQLEMPLAEAYAYAAGVMVENMMAQDAEEGIGAFLDKRDPVWRGC